MGKLSVQFGQLRADLNKLQNTLVLTAALPKFFRERITLAQAEEQIKKLLSTRVERFLELVRVRVYEQAGHPYRRLLQHAGCDYSDLRAHVHRDGLEETLAKLAAEGVYLTSDEFKGKIEVKRGGNSFRVSPGDFERRDLTAGISNHSSGTRNQPVDTLSPLESRNLIDSEKAILCAAHDLFSCAHAVYEPIIAGRVVFVLTNAKLGIPTDRWFALKVAGASALEDKYHRINAVLVAMMARRFGAGIANPQYLNVGDVDPILTWIVEKRRSGQSCCITTVVSNAARIARQALEQGTPLDGTRFQVSGEALTHSKKQIIEKAGARIVLRYGPGGGNGSVLGCGDPHFIDEMHVPQSRITLVENPRSVDDGGKPIHPLMLTTLHGSAPRLLLNVENGDYATLLERNCGCPLQKVGFTHHLHTIRSFEKFTSEGMNYAGTNLFELLEDAMPSEFGGAAGDYQLVEEEDSEGQTRLTLVVHPEVGNIDEERLLSRLQQGLAHGSRNNRFMSTIWQRAGTFRIRREVPFASARGKILPLRINR